MSGLSVFMTKQEKVFKEVIVDFVGAEGLDYEGMIEVQKIVEKCHKEFSESEKKLQAKKESLFKNKNVDKWKLDPQILNTISKEGLLGNKQLAISKMLPKETEDLQEQYISYVYFVNRILEEVARINHRKEKAFNKRLAKIYSRQDGLTQEVDLAAKCSGK
eukprot:TRINITY_DN15434_c0_g1_i6.p3 TRINITY_DN15434_c0_g1~~TRINITY_DN15434_c0_g1_i6.p3  ORF type:complete len:161 (+),score=65.89 TRINITY_DN15434_c0_g1_i6:1251-1733(+)